MLDAVSPPTCTVDVGAARRRGDHVVAQRVRRGRSVLCVLRRGASGSPGSPRRRPTGWRGGVATAATPGVGAERGRRSCVERGGVGARRELGREHERAVEPGAEARRRAGRRRWRVVSARRVVAGVGEAEAHRRTAGWRARAGSTRPPTSAGHGRRWTTRLHRYQMRSLGRLRGARVAADREAGRCSCPTKPSTAGSSVIDATITTAHRRPTCRPPGR